MKLVWACTWLCIRDGSWWSLPASLPGFAGYFHCFTSQDRSKRWCLSGPTTIYFSQNSGYLKNVKKTLVYRPPPPCPGQAVNLVSLYAWDRWGNVLSLLNVLRSDFFFFQFINVAEYSSIAWSPRNGYRSKWNRWTHERPRQETSKCVHVVYEGHALESRIRVYFERKRRNQPDSWKEGNAKLWITVGHGVSFRTHPKMHSPLAACLNLDSPRL